MLLRRSILFVFLVAGWSHAASLVTSTFDVDMEGWGNAGGTKNWSHTNGNLRVQFDELIFPASENAILGGGLLAAGGAFIGDYRASGAWVIGFDFYAEDTNPGELVLDLVGTGNTYRVILQTRLGAVGTTNRLAISLAHRQAGPWVLGPADDAVFESVLTNITQVLIRLQRAGLSPETYRIDNIFLDALPEAGRMATDDEGVAITWEGARPGWTYRIEAAEDLTEPSPWTVLLTTFATNDVFSVIDTNAWSLPFRAYRVLID